MEDAQPGFSLFIMICQVYHNANANKWRDAELWDVILVYLPYKQQEAQH
jgi:hypothetical protein